jgi:F0F1-type ATP synthase delta subunit
LSNEEKKVLEGRFAKVLNSPVSASYLVTPALVGGLKVTANGKTYDGTLSGWLNQVEEVLVGGNI